MTQEFDTINDSGNALNGWFSGFCPSNSIAKKLGVQARSVLAKKTEFDKKYTALENGTQAGEWSDLKNEIGRLEGIIKTETQALKQETGISDALGLGAWCNGAASKRKRAEVTLRNAENALGQIKGAYEVLEKQQIEGIKIAGEQIKTHKATIENLKKQVVIVKQKIAVFKAKRDNEAVTNSAKDKNTSILNKLKENAPVIAGSVVLVSALVYYKNKSK